MISLPSGSWVPTILLLLVYATVVAPLVIAQLLDAPESAIRPALAATAAVIFCVLVQMGLRYGLVLSGDQSWNWFGKLLQIGACLVLVPLMGIKALGLNWHGPGMSDRRALGASILVVCAGVLIWLLVPADENSPPHALLYQATLPGLAEELFYRGALLSLCARISGPHNEPRSGAYVVCTSIFVMDHVLRIEGGKLLFSMEQIWAPLFIGSALAYVRARSGSVYLGVLVHNVFNVVASGFG